MAKNDPRALIDGWFEGTVPVTPNEQALSDGQNPIHQQFESAWWGACLNTFGEEAKQISYAHRMGLVNAAPPDDYEKWPSYDIGGRSVLDIGGGPVSILLKCRDGVNKNEWLGGSRRTVVDPLVMPDGVKARYAHAGIELVNAPAEDFDPGDFVYDECWIYNCLQHVLSPDAVLNVARTYSRAIRIFEYPYTDAHLGHPHTLLPERLDAALGGKGTVENIVKENGISGLAYYGVFPQPK
jgi:hypothetical protein